MAKVNNLADLLQNTGNSGMLEYEPLKRFLALHTVQHHDDINGNGDDVFCGTNIETADRFPHHGYEPGQDKAVYAAANGEDVLDNLRRTQLRVVQRWMEGNQTSDIGQRLNPVLNNIVSRGA